MRNFTSPFNSKDAWGLVACTSVQQLLVASSSLWLVWFTQGLEQRFFEPHWLALFLLSLLLPYYPGAAALYLLKKIEIQRLREFWSEQHQKIVGRLDLRNDPRVRSTVSAIQIKDGPQLMSDLIHFGYDLGATGLNAGLNVLAVSFLVSPWFLMSYLVSLFLVAVLIRFFSERNAAYAGAAESQKTALNGVLGRAWENLTLNNRSNKHFWGQRYHAQFESWTGAALTAEASRHFTSVALTTATFVPTLTTLTWFTFSHQENFNELLAMTVLLPRIYMILNHTSALIYLVRDISFYRGRFRQLEQASRLPEIENLDRRIRYEVLELTLDGAPLAPTDLFTLKWPANGWITVRGPNGAGKSSLLARLKQEFGERAFYYPAHADLDFQNGSEPVSTGQKTLRDLEEILTSEPAGILMLDEWDANLDAAHKARLENRLREVSRTRLLIDVRH